MTATEIKAGPATGTIVQIIGPVLDVEFPPDQLPELYNALSVNDAERPGAGPPGRPRCSSTSAATRCARWR